MNFVFVTCRMVMGGNETLILRMSEWLLSEGHSVTVLAAQGGYLADKMPSGCNVIIVGSFKFGAAVVPFFPYEKKIKNAFKHADVAMSFSGGGCMFSYHLFKRFSSKAKLISGVFHPNTGVGEIPYFNSVFWDAIFNENKFYMNKAISEDHKQQGYMVDNIKLWNLPVIYERKDDNLFSGFDSNIILSIGRLTEFKGYNYYMIDIIKELVEQGFKDIEWHVIGDDEPDTREPVKEYMQSKIIEYGLENNIKLHGIVDYKALPRFINKSKIFIGMGTSAVEACATGVPTICAVVDDKEGNTYGYMWDQPQGCVGEKLVNVKPEIKVVDLIKNVLLLNEAEYQQISATAMSITDDFLLDNQMQEFMSLLKSTKVGTNKKPSGRMNRILKKLINRLT